MTRVVFMGSPDFAVPTLCAVAAEFELVGIVTQPDRAAGRGGRMKEPAVKVAARELPPVTLIQPESLRDPDVVEQINALAPDLFVVAAYGKILSKKVLAIPTRGSLNVHASILPRWRGASPIAAAIRAGDPETGVTIMEMALKMDAGAVVGTGRMSIDRLATTGDLEPQLAELGAKLLMELVPRWLTGELVAQPQNEEDATYCNTLSKKDAHLSAALTAHEAERTVRAYSPWPGAYVEYKGDRLAIWRAHVEDRDAPVGALVPTDRQPAIGFKDGLLVLDEVQQPGRRRMSGTSFLNGQQGKLEERVTLA